MIIIGQDKDIIVNFSRCNGILQEANEVVAMLEGQEWVIGIYRTEERAKEVLQEIVEEYEANIITVPIYYMPKE